MTPKSEKNLHCFPKVMYRCTEEVAVDTLQSVVVVLTQLNPGVIHTAVQYKQHVYMYVVYVTSFRIRELFSVE